MQGVGENSNTAVGRDCQDFAGDCAHGGERIIAGADGRRTYLLRAEITSHVSPVTGRIEEQRIGGNRHQGSGAGRTPGGGDVVSRSDAVDGRSRSASQAGRQGRRRRGYAGDQTRNGRDRWSGLDGDWWEWRRIDGERYELLAGSDVGETGLQKLSAGRRGKHGRGERESDVATRRRAGCSDGCGAGR